MADNDNNNNNGEGTTARGADWEVVQLTASTYAAAPAPDKLDSADDTGASEKSTETETSDALIVSSHFVFPPKDHENLPIEPEVGEIHGESESLSTEGVETGSGNDPELELSGDRDTVNYMAYTASKGVQRMNTDEEVEGMLDDSQASGIREAYGSGSHYEPMEASDETPESPGMYAKHSEEKKHDGSNIPSDAWWKRHAASVYRQAKEGNRLWSIVVAATVVGIVILGHRWQRGKWQFNQHKWRLCAADERMSRLLSRYK